MPPQHFCTPTMATKPDTVNAAATGNNVMLLNTAALHAVYCHQWIMVHHRRKSLTKTAS